MKDAGGTQAALLLGEELSYRVQSLFYLLLSESDDNSRGGGDGDGDGRDDAAPSTLPSRSTDGLLASCTGQSPGVYPSSSRGSRQRPREQGELGSRGCSHRGAGPGTRWGQLPGPLSGVLEAAAQSKAHE